MFLTQPSESELDLEPSPRMGSPPRLCYLPELQAMKGQCCGHTCVLFGGRRVSVLEELDGRVATDTILLGQVRLFSGIHLGQSDLGTFCLQLPSCFGILWGQSLAVATPWGIWERKQDLEGSTDPLHCLPSLLLWYFPP